MKVLITGGAGYIGSELVYQLSQKEDVSQIIVYDNLTRENFNLFISNSNRIGNNKVKFEFGDLLDSRKLRKVMKGVEVVYHLAARVSTPFSNVDSHFFEQVNNWGTAELVYAVEDTPSISRLIFLSSTSVYGASKTLLDESSTPNPRTFYSISKMRGEEHVKRLLDKKKTYIIRCGNAYGYTPSIRFDSVINKFMFDANFNNRISIHGSGKQTRSFINVNKVVSSLVEMRNNDMPSDVYNLIDKNMEILDLVDVLKEIYPDLEFIFINQHLELRELQVNPETKLSKYIALPETDFKKELLAFKDRFAFTSQSN
ncbi:SDR family oxidoreductase [Cytophagaceae bacterium ABcell3]|nr:SDR family oxidoreductase [Cytophagaceae bacterium ABcell3]